MSRQSRTTIIRFGGYELNVRAGELRRDNGTPARIQDKPLQLLLLLLERPGELVTREEIRERVWGPSRYYDFEDSLNQAVRKLRGVLGESASNPRFIETIPRRGYRLISPVEEHRRPDGGSNGMGGAREGAVGRQRELSELHLEAAAAAEGSGRVVCISGEPGIGKTTLAECLCEQLSAERDTRIVIGRCSERLAGTEAYLPVLEALENSIVGDDCAACAELLKRTAPSWFLQLAHALSGIDTGEPPAVDAWTASQERRKREFLTYVDASSRERPLVLFIEDLHWADVSTVDLLSYVAARCAAMPLLILGTYRPSDLLLSRHPFLDVRLELQTRRLFREIELTPLGQDDVKTYVDLKFPGNRFPANFNPSIYQRTEGSPLFMADLLRDMRNTGIIAVEEGEWVLTRPLAEIQNAIPDSVRGMVERKIGKLSPDHRRLLETASVQGYDFQSSVLARVSALDGIAVEETLDYLERKHRLVRLIKEESFPDSTFTLHYTFSHALYQEFLYDSLHASRKAALSAAVAEELIALHRGGVEIASQLGPLFETARDRNRAAHFFAIAAANAGKLSANRQAVGLATRALENARQLEGDIRERRLLEAGLRLAEARLALSEFERSIKHFEFAASAAERLGDVESQVDALCGAAISCGYVKDMDGMRERGSKALEAARAAGTTPAFAQSVLGFERMFAGDLGIARHYLDQALPALRNHGPVHAAVFASGSRALLDHFQSEYRDADEVLDWAMEQLRRHGSCSDLLRNLWVRGMVLGNQGRVSAALDTLMEGMRLADLNKEAFWFSRLPNTIGWIYSEILDFESGLRFNEEGVRTGQSSGTPETEGNSHINLASIYLALHDHGRAREHLDEGDRLLNEHRHKRWLRWRFNIRLDLEFAGYELALEDAERARRHAGQALSRASEAGARKHAAAAHKLLGDVCALEENFAGSAWQYDAALAILDRNPCPLIDWKISRSAASVAAYAGDPKRASRLHKRFEKTAALVGGSIRDDKLRRRFLESAGVKGMAPASRASMARGTPA
ncbi:MAG TPA: AAA family ATPase [Bryobacteraceae bacterium]|nr:AAA family ATPase [Bryobacteraceae bacterium]